MPSSAPNPRGQTRKQQSENKKIINASKPKKQKSAPASSTEQVEKKKTQIITQNASRTQSGKRPKEEHTFSTLDTKIPSAANKKTKIPQTPKILEIIGSPVFPPHF